MTTEQRQETERIIFSGFLAIAIHAVVILILYISDAIVIEDVEDHFGTIFVKSIVVSTGPSTEESDQQLVEQPAVLSENIQPIEEFVVAGESPDAQPEDAVMEQETGHGTATEPDGPTQDDAPNSDRPLVEEPQPPQHSRPATLEEDHIYEGSYEDESYRIQMDRKTKKAQPAIRIPVNLPKWVHEQEKEIVVVLSYVLDGDGRVTALTVTRSSGYDDVDEAVRRAFFQWKFSNPRGEDRTTGTFTYKVN